MADRLVTIIGGSGFLGRYVVRELARAGWRIRVLCRHPAAADYLKTAGELGQISVMYGDLARPESTVLPYMFETDAVVNLVGVLYEHGRQRFDVLHAKSVQAVANAARMGRVGMMVHVSAIGAGRVPDSHYATSKFQGEQAVRVGFPESAILRPGVIFGPEDQFLNRFAQMAMVLPFLPAIGGGKTMFQPVYVGDVARAVRICLENASMRGKTFELGGPEQMSMKRILEYVLSQTGRKARLLDIPFPAASFMSAFTKWLPGALKLTPDQVRLLRYDNTVDTSALNCSTLGISPTAMDLVAPQYLLRYRRPGLAYA